MIATEAPLARALPLATDVPTAVAASDDAVESAVQGRAGGVVHDRLAVGTDGRELLQASEALATPRGEDDELHEVDATPPVSTGERWKQVRVLEMC